MKNLRRLKVLLWHTLVKYEIDKKLYVKVSGWVLFISSCGHFGWDCEYTTTQYTRDIYVYLE